MGRYGLGFGAQASARPSRGGSPADGAARIAPGAAWTGEAGSGFTAAPPADPDRVTAKPALRLLTPPKQAFTSTQLVGVLGGANDEGTLIDNLGIEKVIVHCEGNTIDIDAPTTRSFADANGQTVQYFGWWAALEKPSGVDGAAEVYFEAVPRDPTMQNRVIGPFTYFPVDTLHDFAVELAASAPEVAGESYQTIQGALEFFRSMGAKRPQITAVETAQYDIPGSSFPYQFEGWCEFRATVPITITIAEDADHVSFRPRRGPIRFVGSNITIDFVRSFELHTEPGHEPFWCDGVQLTNSAGRDSLRLKAPRNILTHLIRDFGWMTECEVTNLWSAGARCQLVRGCHFANCWGDLFTGSLAVVGCVADGLDSGWYRQYRDALAVSFTGSGVASLELSGANGTNGRVFTAKLDGATVDSFTVNTGDAAHDADTNYTVANVADWLNTLSDWSASVIDNDRYAAALQIDGSIGAWGPVTISGAPTVISSFLDVHADIFQTSGENIVLAGNVGFGIDAQVFFHTGGVCSDMLLINNAFDTLSTSGLLSQFSNTHSHVVFVHNALARQKVLLRGSNGFDPDSYSLIANNALAALDYSGAVDPELLIAFNHLGSGAVAPSGAIATTIGGSADGNFASASTGDFTPQGALLAFPKPPAIRIDAEGNARRSPVAPVGAVRGPVGTDVTAPTIISADPSGSYLEGSVISGQLAASEPASWLVSGSDAALVTLDPDSGAWSLGPTDFDLKAAYAFTFEAIDAAGNASSQPVAIAITQASGAAPILSNVSDDANGASAASLSLDTDTGNGILHWALTTDGSTPDAAAIKSGSGFAASGSQAVTAIGPQLVAIAGLAASTSYVAHVVHTAASGQDSAVASGDGFATLPAGPQADAIIIITAGQSNSRKAATDPAAVPARYTALSDTHMWIAASNGTAPYVAGTNSGHEGAQPEWGTEAERIYQMREAGETRPIFVVKESVNGQALASVGGGDWHPGNSGERFERLETQVSDLRAWLSANTAHASFDEEILWNQGEADCNEDATANAYAANWVNFLSEFRSRISTGFFIAERIRPLGYAPGGSVTTTQGYTRAYTVREAVQAGILADGNGAVMDTDFDTANFPQLHPQEPDPWTINSWTTQIGLRAHAVRTGTYDAVYGAITNTAPVGLAIPASSGEEGSMIASASIVAAGIERRAPVVLPAGVEMRILNQNGSLHTDWTGTPGFVDKFQSFTLRALAPADGATDMHQISIGGVTTDWALTGAAASSYRGDTQAWIDALSGAGGTSLSPAQADGLDAFLDTLDTAGILAKIGGHAYALGSEIANRIRLDDPAAIATQEGLTDLPWSSGGYKATDNGQHVDIKLDPSAVTTPSDVSLTVVVSELAFSSAYSVNSLNGTLGLSLRNASTVRFRAHGTHVNFSGLSLSKTGAYTGTSDGTTAKLYDPDGIEIGSTSISPDPAATATELVIGNHGTTDKANRIWGVALSTLLSPAEIATLHGELQTLRALF